MAERAKFQELQYQLAAHIRDPDENPAPTDIEDRRLAIYRDLFFNNVAQMLAGTFPVLHKILGEKAWRELMRDYFAHHQAHTPYFLEMPREFLSFLENERAAGNDDPAFMLELAHYEWIELALSVSEKEIDLENVDTDGDLLAGEPVVSPLIEVLAYRFPVHRLGPDFQPSAPPAETTWLVVYRNLEDRAGFMEINLVTARLLELAGAGGLTGTRILTQIAEELGHQNPDVVIKGGADTLKLLKEKSIILGTRTNRK